MLLNFLLVWSLSNKSVDRSNIHNYKLTRYDSFCFCDLDLDPMTFIDEYDLTMPKMHPHDRNKLSRSTLSKVIVLQTENVRAVLTVQSVCIQFAVLPYTPVPHHLAQISGIFLINSSLPGCRRRTPCHVDTYHTCRPALVICPPAR